MTPERLAELTRICDAATPGPWVEHCDGIETTDPGSLDITAKRGPYKGAVVVTDSGVYPPHEDDAAFICAARTAMPELLAEVGRLQSMLEPLVVSQAQYEAHLALMLVKVLK